MFTDYIQRYFFSFLVYGMTAACMIFISSFVKSKIAGQQRHNFNNWTMLLFALYMAFLFSITILPEIELSETGLQFARMYSVRRPVSLIPLHEIRNDLRDHSAGSFLNLAGNIVMFIPYGFLLPIVTEKKKFSITLIPFLTSIAIETIQLFEGRRCDIDDVILNTVGAILGWTIFVTFSYPKKQRLRN